LKFVNVGDKLTTFAKVSVSIILVVSLETTKMCIGPKRARGLKRLGHAFLNK